MRMGSILAFSSDTSLQRQHGSSAISPNYSTLPFAGHTAVVVYTLRLFTTTLTYSTSPVAHIKVVVMNTPYTPATIWEVLAFSPAVNTWTWNRSSAVTGTSLQRACTTQKWRSCTMFEYVRIQIEYRSSLLVGSKILWSHLHDLSKAFTALETLACMILQRIKALNSPGV